MSNDNNQSEPFDFNFDSLNAEESQAGSSSFDLDNPFGDDMVVTRSGGESSFELDNPSESGQSETDDGAKTEDPSENTDDSGFNIEAADSGVSADNPYLTDPASAPEKKKGFLGGLFGGKGKKKEKKEKKAKKGKETPEPQETASEAKEPKAKKEKAKKEKVEKKPKEPTGPRAPLDWGTLLCLGVAGLLAFTLLVVNAAAFLSAKEGMPLILFLGVINLLGLAAISVPLLFLRADKKDRTLPNVLLGISVVALFGGLLLVFTDLYSYSFIVKP